MRALAQADAVAGLTVAVMAVPQSVSFAAMAGLPAAYGLYTAFVPVIAFCVMGSSRHLVRAGLLTAYLRHQRFVLHSVSFAAMAGLPAAYGW